MKAKQKVSFRWAFKEYIWPRRKIVSIGLLLIIIRSLSGLVLPYASKAQIDEVIPSKDIYSLTYLLIAVGVALLKELPRRLVLYSNREELSQKDFL